MKVKLTIPASSQALYSANVDSAMITVRSASELPLYPAVMPAPGESQLAEEAALGALVMLDMPVGWPEFSANHNPGVSVVESSV